MSRSQNKKLGRKRLLGSGDAYFGLVILLIVQGAVVYNINIHFQQQSIGGNATGAEAFSRSEFMINNGNGNTPPRVARSNAIAASGTARISETARIPEYNTIHDNDNILPRALAFVFPQFHEDSLNNQLWGKGFTVWDNLRKAPAKNRKGFAIPRLTELGYYNYIDVEPRTKQGELARQYGIDGFLFHHYWFYDDSHPGPNLHQPIVSMLRDGHPNVPFALQWCAIKWMDTWSGKKMNPEFVFKEGPGVVQKQYFPENDNDGKINFLKRFFHPNYIKVDGKPVLMMYQKKPGSFPVLRILKELASLEFPGLYITVGLSKPHVDLMDVIGSLFNL